MYLRTPIHRRACRTILGSFRIGSKSDAPYSQVVLDDNYAYLSGLVSADFPEGQAKLGDVEKETRAVLTAVNRILEEIGLDMGRIVRVDVHLASLDDFDAMAVHTELDHVSRLVDLVS